MGRNWLSWERSPARPLTGSESVRALTEAGIVAEHPLPQGVAGTLRPYQRDGFRWLGRRCTSIGLGGVLADDMGLGKTLQTLALICHAREHGRSPGPFLVVAPASVVHNWVERSGAVRAGSRRAVGHSDPRAPRRSTSPRRSAGADIVVTSYTLFRLEFDEYEALDWAGLVLDEAQFVKNPQSQGYRCAKLLPAPFKLAITGTPMENNLRRTVVAVFHHRAWPVPAPGPVHRVLPQPDREGPGR